MKFWDFMNEHFFTMAILIFLVAMMWAPKDAPPCKCPPVITQTP